VGEGAWILSDGDEATVDGIEHDEAMSVDADELDVPRVERDQNAWLVSSIQLRAPEQPWSPAEHFSLRLVALHEHTPTFELARDREQRKHVARGFSRC